MAEDGEMTATQGAMDPGLSAEDVAEATRAAFEQMILANHDGRAEVLVRGPGGLYKYLAAESAWIVWKAAAQWAVDQAQATDDDVVRAFEHWFSDEGAWPKAVERRGGQYVLSQASAAWGAWRAGAACVLERRQALREAAGLTVGCINECGLYCRSERTDMGDPTRGLYNKFDVRRVDGSSDPGGKHHGCEYIVLDLTHDKHAEAALRAYAASCAAEYPLLAADLLHKLDDDEAAAYAWTGCGGLQR